MSTIPRAQSQHSSAGGPGCSCSPELLRAGLSTGLEEEDGFTRKDGDGMWLIGLGREGEELVQPRGAARVCGAALLPAGEGSALLLQDVLLVGRRVGGLGGTLPAPSLLAAGGVGKEEALGVVSSAAQPDALMMSIHDDAIPWGDLQDRSDTSGPPRSLCRALGSRKPFPAPGLTLCQHGHMEKPLPLSHRGEIEPPPLALSQHSQPLGSFLLPSQVTHLPSSQPS